MNLTECENAKLAGILIPLAAGKTLISIDMCSHCRAESLLPVIWEEAASVHGHRGLVVTRLMTADDRILVARIKYRNSENERAVCPMSAFPAIDMAESDSENDRGTGIDLRAMESEDDIFELEP